MNLNVLVNVGVAKHSNVNNGLLAVLLVLREGCLEAVDSCTDDVGDHFNVNLLLTN
jgi:hypothetical protein